MEYYTYIHIKENKPIYVGKGKGNRAYQKRDYDNYQVKIVDKNISEQKALELEEFLIQEIGVNNLYNKYLKGVPQQKIIVDYKHYNQYKKTLRNMSAKEIYKVAQQIINDACGGNLKAIKICLPLIKINNLSSGVSNG